MIIKVTKTCIAYGERGNCLHCPVAIAVRNAAGNGVILVSVCDEEIIIDRKHIKISLKSDVSCFIRKFDDGVHVEPFEFEINYENA